jgi:hypothetical protein
MSLLSSGTVLRLVDSIGAHFGAPVHGGTRRLRTRPARPSRRTFIQRLAPWRCRKTGRTIARAITEGTISRHELRQAESAEQHGVIVVPSASIVDFVDVGVGQDNQ